MGAHICLFFSRFFCSMFFSFFVSLKIDWEFIMIELFPSGMWHPHGINTHQATTPGLELYVSVRLPVCPPILSACPSVRLFSIRSSILTCVWRSLSWCTCDIYG